MSRQSQLAVVAGSTLAFAGFLVYLSSVIYPLVLLGGAYIVMQQRGETTLWRELWTRLDEYKSTLLPPPQSNPTAAKLDGEPTGNAVESPRKASPPSQASPPKRRSRVVKLQRGKSSAPSLRVVEVGVSSDGSPREDPSDSEGMLHSIVQPNSMEPYEFENDFMKGRLLFLLQRSDQATPAKYYALFEGKRRLFWIQLQVQFKKVPSGILYIGGEVPRPMNLGFFTGGLTKIILTVLQSLVRGIHCGFGQPYPEVVKSPEDEDLPHICFPLYTAVDQFVVTPPGEKPPVLGRADFGESKESMAARRKHGQPMYQYNTTDTYSFHFHSFFIDFSTWRLVGIPGMRDTDLSAFWEDMPLRLCAYSLKPREGVDPNSEAEAKKASHAMKHKEYKFCFQMSHKVQDEYEVVEELGNSSTPVDDGSITASGRRQSEVDSEHAAIRAELSKFEFDVPVWFEYFSTSPAHAERRVGYAIRVRAVDNEESDKSSGKEYMVLLPAVAAFSPLSYLEHDLVMTASRRASGRHGVFGGSRARTLEEAISVKSRISRYSKVDEERKFLEHQLHHIAKADATEYGSVDHVMRAQKALLEILENKAPSTALGSEWQFLTTAFVRRNSFGSSVNVLATELPSMPISAPVKDSPQAAAQIVRAVSSSCWRNEWVTMDRSQRVLNFFRMLASSASHSIALDDILAVEDDEMVHDPDRECELYWFRLVSITKCHHIAFAAPEDRFQWKLSLQREIEASGTAMADLVRQPIIKVCLKIEPEAYLSDTASKSRGTKRFVLNDRCDFNPSTGDVKPSSLTDPNSVVASALKLALRLHARRLEQDSTKDLLEFLDAVSVLKWVDLSQIEADETERKVFLLNLYHLIVLHSSILGFLPRSKTQWSKFFNGTTYNVGGIHLSVAEIDHGLVRSAMTPLKLAIAFLVIPKIGDSDERASLRLTKPDFRLNFALNCLTKSCVNFIIVFTKQDLDKQLDHVTSLTLDYLVSYDRESKIMYLPKVCEWYRQDFTSDSSYRWPQAILTKLHKYLTGSKAQLVEYLLQHEQALVSKWKFVKYDYHFHESVAEATLPAPV